MIEEKNEIQIIEHEIAPYEQSQRAQIDIAVATAKKYPRNLSKFKANVIATVTIDEKTASVCGYTLPRGDKKIHGASVHLARILAQNYGNLRVEKHGLMIGDNYLTAEATCLDLETNYGERVEVRRKIISKNGQRYNEDMINMTMMAAMAVAERNAILAVIPRGFTDAAYEAAQHKLTGDLSDEEKLTAARQKALDYFLKNYDVKEEEVLNVFGKTSKTQLTSEDLASLRGLMQSLKDGDTTVDEAFMRETGDNPDGEGVKNKADNFENETEGKEPKEEKPNEPVKKDEVKPQEAASGSEAQAAPEKKTKPGPKPSEPGKLNL